jgi:hypothetical protein
MPAEMPALPALRRLVTQRAGAEACVDANERFGNEDKCHAYLEDLRWPLCRPNGFIVALLAARTRDVVAAVLLGAIVLSGLTPAFGSNITSDGEEDRDHADQNCEQRE